jgi:hypothetical protein
MNVPDGPARGVLAVGVDLGGRNDETAVVVCEPLGGSAVPTGVDVVNAATMPLRDGRDAIGYHAAQFEILAGVVSRYVADGYAVRLGIDVTREDAASDQLRTTFAPLLATGRVELVRVWFVAGEGRPKVKASAAPHDTKVHMPKNGLVHLAQALGQRDRAAGGSFVRHVGYPTDVQAKMMRQLSAFAAKVTKAGNVTYDASRGHDDLVTAYMLALFLAAGQEPLRIHNPARRGGASGSAVAARMAQSMGSGQSLTRPR